LVIVLHGGSGTGAGMPPLTGTNAVADQKGFIAVYPDGIQKKWADGRNPSSVNDVAFLSSLVSQLATDVGVDQSRVYATGISNGGFMSTRLACEASNVFAAVAVVAATMPQNIVAGCAPNRVVPFMLIHGTADTLVPDAGGQVTVGDGGLILSTADTVTFWRGVNGCSSTTATSSIDTVNDGTSITLNQYTNCKAGGEVAFYNVTGGGHTWPGGLQYLPQIIIGKTSRDMNASAVIWSFFSRFSRP
jgi:polyhydroxybutyrate depolymerase